MKKVILSIANEAATGEKGMTVWIKRFRNVALLLISIYLTGCASASNPGSMAIQGYVVPVAIGDSVTVSVEGGNETSSMGASQIANEDFAEAITLSILTSGVFNQVIKGDASEYMLNVFIVSLDQPVFGGSFTVRMESAWRLLERQSGLAVWERVINSEHTATMGDALVAATRLRLANEGAAQNGIRQAIIALSEMNF